MLIAQGGSFAVRNGSLVQVVTTDPGPNAWVQDPDPITLLGDVTPWGNVSVSVTSWFPKTASMLTDSNPPAVVQPCAAGDGAQIWQFNVTGAGYLSNSLPSGDSVCLNSDGCGDTLIYYECVTSGGTCCGSDCYEGLQFEVRDGLLTTPLLPGMCATVQSDGSSVQLDTCAAGNSNQQWVYTPATGVLLSVGTNKCLTSSLAPPRQYIMLCSRIPSYSGFQPNPVPGLCVTYNATGSWQVLAGTTVLGSGSLPSAGPSFDPSEPRKLTLTATGTTATAVIDSIALGTFDVPASYAAGLVAIGSGYHVAYFDDFSVSA